MKTSTILGLGALAAIAYWIYTQNQTSAIPITTSPIQYVTTDAANATNAAQQQAYIVTQNLKGGSPRVQTFSTVKQGISYLNNAWSSGTRILPSTTTIASGVTATITGGWASGKTLKGNIVDLGSGPKFVGIV